MATKQKARKVAVINSSAAVIELLRTLLETAGYETVTAHIDDIKSGRLDLLGFLKTHDPQVVIYDISITPNRADCLSHFSKRHSLFGDRTIAAPAEAFSSTIL